MTSVASCAGVPVPSKMRPPRNTSAPIGPPDPGGTGVRRGSSDTEVDGERNRHRSVRATLVSWPRAVAASATSPAPASAIACRTIRSAPWCRRLPRYALTGGTAREPRRTRREPSQAARFALVSFLLSTGAPRPIGPVGARSSLPAPLVRGKPPVFALTPATQVGRRDDQLQDVDPSAIVVRPKPNDRGSRTGYPSMRKEPGDGRRAAAAGRINPSQPQRGEECAHTERRSD